MVVLFAATAGGSGCGAEKARERGGTLTLLARIDVDTIDPGRTIAVPYTHYAQHRPLYVYGPDDTEPSPDLATAPPKVTDNGRTLTMRLRRGVRFSPPVNREVRSEDVRYAIERGFRPQVASSAAAQFFGDLKGVAAFKAGRTSHVAGIQTPDRRTIVLRFSRPRAEFMRRALALPLTAPVPPEYAARFDRKTPSTYAQHVVATGPYMVENDSSGRITGWRPGVGMKLVRNPNWDRRIDARPAHLDRIQMRVVPDVDVALRQVIGGTNMVLAFGPPPTPSLIKRLTTGGEREQLVSVPVSGFIAMAMNTTVEPFDDVNVRRAVVAAADRALMIAIDGGPFVSTPATHFLPPVVGGFEEAGGLRGPPLDFLSRVQGDLALAKRYMRRAGYPTGRYTGRQTLTIVGPADAPPLHEALLTPLKRLGFRVRARRIGVQAIVTQECSRPRNRIPICFQIRHAEGVPDPENLLGRSFDGRAIRPEANENYSQLDVPQINDAIRRAEQITDPSRRLQAWGQVDRLITAQAPSIPVKWIKMLLARSKNVNGAVNRSVASWDLSYTSLSR